MGANISTDYTTRTSRRHNRISRRTRKNIDIGMNIGMGIGQNIGLSLPQGNWINTSRNPRVQGNILYAELLNKNGIWVLANTQYRNGDEFINDNGSFRFIRNNMGFNMRSRRSSRKYNNKFPMGNWINTAKNYYIEGNILHADLKNREGIYVKATTYYHPNDILENNNGIFKIIGVDNMNRMSRHGMFPRGRSHHRMSYRNGIYSHDQFSVYYNGKKIDCSPMGFQDLGYGYAKDSFSVYYKGSKMNNVFVNTFQIINNGYAKDSFSVYYRGEKVNGANPFNFIV